MHADNGSSLVDLAPVWVRACSVFPCCRRRSDGSFGMRPWGAVTSNAERLVAILSTRVAQNVVGALLGVALALQLRETPLGDPTAPTSWVFASVLVVLALFRTAAFIPLLAVLGVLAISLGSSLAVGSSWAAMTWMPIIIAVVAASRLSPAFILTLVSVALLRDGATLVVLYQVFNATFQSGSTPYFLGFAGAVGAFFWFRVALDTTRSMAHSVSVAVAVLMSAVSVWAVLASGSRAALLALGMGLMVLAAGWVVRKPRVSLRSRSLLGVVVTIVVLVAGLDLGLGWAFGTGRSTIAIALGPRVQDTIAEVDQVRSGQPSDAQVRQREPGNVGYRLAWWGQAASAVMQRPQGHGLGSFAHVTHAYQDAPMLWSASPHNIWLRVAVEGGLPAVLALAGLVVGGFVVAWRRGSVAAAAALLAATVVMTLDVMDVMPVQSLVWWSAIGTAWGRAGEAKGMLRLGAAGVLIAVLATSVYYSVRLSAPCGEGCDPIVQYGGHPRIAGPPRGVIGSDPADARWGSWAELYPYAFWLRHAHADTMRETDDTALLRVLSAYPFHAAHRYVDAALDAADGRVARDIASCGLQRFFDGSVIWRTSRVTLAELDEQRSELQRIAGQVDGSEAACERVGIPAQPLGFQAR